MIEHRWKVETWIEFPADGLGEIRHTEKPVLQARYKVDENTVTEWIDVPTEYVEV